MVKVSVAADHFLQALIKRLSDISDYPPSHQSLRTVLLDWVNQLPIPEVQEYLLADFATHLKTVFDALSAASLAAAKGTQTPPQFQDSESKIKTSSTISETIPYLNSSSIKYTAYLKELVSTYSAAASTPAANQSSPTPSTSAPFWQILSTILSPCPISFQRSQTTALFEAKFTILFEFLVQYLPIEQHRHKSSSSPQDYQQFQTTLQQFSQTFISSIFEYISNFPRKFGTHQVHLLTRAVTALCLLLPFDEMTSGSGAIWLTTITQTITNTVPSFSTTQFYVELLAFWSHFILVPSLCFSQQKRFIASNKYVLLGQDEFSAVSEACKHSPTILSALIPYFEPILTSLGPDQTPEIYTHDITTSTLLFVFSMFQHIAPVLRFYNTPQYASHIDLQLFKTKLLQLAKTIQHVTIRNESALLPPQLQSLCQSYTLRIKTRQQKAEQNKREKGTPLLALTEDSIVTFKDIFTNEHLKALIIDESNQSVQPNANTSQFPYTIGLEIIVLYIQKSHTDYQSTFASTTAIVTNARQISKNKNKNGKQSVANPEQDQFDLLLSSLTSIKTKTKTKPTKLSTESESTTSNENIVRDSLDDQLFAGAGFQFQSSYHDDGDDFGDSSVSIQLQLQNIISGVSTDFANDLKDFGDVDIEM